MTVIVDQTTNIVEVVTTEKQVVEVIERGAQGIPGSSSDQLTTQEVSDVRNLRNSKGDRIWDLQIDSGVERLKSDMPVVQNNLSGNYGKQFQQGASPDNFFFKNLTNGELNSSSWQTIKDPSVKVGGVYANHGAGRLTPTSTRIYDRELTYQVFSAAEKTPLEYVNYRVTANFANPTSGMGLKFRTGEALSVGDILILDITNIGGVDRQFQTQNVVDQAYSVGDFVEFWYEFPAEIQGGSVDVTMSLQKGVSAQPLSFQVSSDINGRAYDEGTFSEFKDVPLALNEIVKASSATTIYYETAYDVDTTASTVPLTLDMNANVGMFEVFDGKSNFHINSAFVTIGFDTYELDKKGKIYKFYLDETNTWKVTEKDIKVT